MNLVDWVLSSVTAVLIFFLRDFHASVKLAEKERQQQLLSHAEEIGRLKGKIELVDQQSRADFSRLESIVDLKLTTIQKAVDRLSENFDKYIKQSV